MDSIESADAGSYANMQSAANAHTSTDTIASSNRNSSETIQSEARNQTSTETIVSTIFNVLEQDNSAFLENGMKNCKT